jgi:hypothetical protein
VRAPNARMRSLVSSELTWFRQYRSAVAGDGPDTVDEVLARRKTAPLWQRHPAVLNSLHESGAVSADETSVTLRWDLIPEEDRDAAISWANELVAQYRGRTAGAVADDHRNSPGSISEIHRLTRPGWAA